jgi:hypothetical protein
MAFGLSVAKEIGCLPDSQSAVAKNLKPGNHRLKADVLFLPGLRITDARHQLSPITSAAQGFEVYFNIDATGAARFVQFKPSGRLG